MAVHCRSSVFARFRGRLLHLLLHLSSGPRIQTSGVRWYASSRPRRVAVVRREAGEGVSGADEEAAVRVAFDGLESPAKMEAAGVVVDGVDGDEASGGVLGGEAGPVEGFEEEADAEPRALFGAVDGEAGEEDDGDGIAAKPPGEASGGLGRHRAAHGQDVIADDLVGIVDEDEGSGSVLFLGDEGVVVEPLVEDFVAATKAGSVVVFLESLDSHL